MMKRIMGMAQSVVDTVAFAKGGVYLLRLMTGAEQEKLREERDKLRAAVDELSGDITVLSRLREDMRDHHDAAMAALAKAARGEQEAIRERDAALASLQKQVIAMTHCEISLADAIRAREQANRERDAANEKLKERPDWFALASDLAKHMILALNWLDSANEVISQGVDRDDADDEIADAMLVSARARKALTAWEQANVATEDA